MKHLFVAILFFILSSYNKVFTQYVWFSGYSYNAQFLLNQKEEELFNSSRNKSTWSILNYQISLANYYWLYRDYFSCKQHLLGARYRLQKNT
jgi:hypothetical protein